MEAGQARLAAQSSAILAEFQERLAIMVADAERIQKLSFLSPGQREEARQVGRAMAQGLQRLERAPR